VEVGGSNPLTSTGKDQVRGYIAGLRDEAFLEAWARAAGERVEVACGGGRGRTGTALACLAVIEGVAPGGAVDYVRRHYDRRAVDTPWQRRYVARFRSRGG
jgi:protein-tyrosine phosphatase